MDHCPGWVESYPLPNKSNKSVWDAFSRKFLPQHGTSEVVITDNGTEFCAGSFMRYLKQLGIEHRRTTLYHPEANGKVERFHRIQKHMLAKLINNQTADREEKLT